MKFRPVETRGNMSYPYVHIYIYSVCVVLFEHGYSWVSIVILAFDGNVWSSWNRSKVYRIQSISIYKTRARYVGWGWLPSATSLRHLFGAPQPGWSLRSLLPQCSRTTCQRRCRSLEQFDAIWCHSSTVHRLGSSTCSMLKSSECVCVCMPMDAHASASMFLRCDLSLSHFGMFTHFA